VIELKETKGSEAAMGQVCTGYERRGGYWSAQDCMCKLGANWKSTTRRHRESLFWPVAKQSVVNNQPSGMTPWQGMLFRVVKRPTGSAKVVEAGLGMCITICSIFGTKTA
jgi:hypothetical protein